MKAPYRPGSASNALIDRFGKLEAESEYFDKYNTLHDCAEGANHRPLETGIGRVSSE